MDANGVEYLEVLLLDLFIEIAAHVSHLLFHLYFLLEFAQFVLVYVLQAMIEEVDYLVALLFRGVQLELGAEGDQLVEVEDHVQLF